MLCLAARVSAAVARTLRRVRGVRHACSLARVVTSPPPGDAAAPSCCGAATAADCVVASTVLVVASAGGGGTTAVFSSGTIYMSGGGSASRSLRSLRSLQTLRKLSLRGGGAGLIMFECSWPSGGRAVRSLTRLASGACGCFGCCTQSVGRCSSGRGVLRRAVPSSGASRGLGLARVGIGMWCCLMTGCMPWRCASSAA